MLKNTQVVNIFVQALTPAMQSSKSLCCI